MMNGENIFKKDEEIEKHMKERGKLIKNVYFTIKTYLYLEILQWAPSRDWSRLVMLS